MACILNSELCPLLVKVAVEEIDGVAADSEPTNTAESDTDTDKKLCCRKEAARCFMSV